MEIVTFILIIISIAVIWIVVTRIKETLSNSQKYIELKPRLDDLDNSTRAHEANVELWNKQVKANAELWNKQVEKDKDEILKIARQKSMGFPWLAEAYAEYFSLKDLQKEDYLKHKKHPAFTAAETVREIKNEKKLLVLQNKIIQYKINYFEKIFPWLSELIAEDENEEIPVRIDFTNQDEDGEDSIKIWLTQEEYGTLPSVEKNQKALDRYLESRNKSKWAIGRDYEMYIGYLYENKGYAVEYKGIIDGFDDLGRDVIAKNDKETCIIQCKYWAQYKEIHEKHIFQLFGTTMEYWIRNFGSHEKRNSFKEFIGYLNENRLRSIFVCSTSLSNKAKEMAAVLNVEIVESFPIGNFPRVKCNINYDEFGLKTKIYHLPMDQQYDRTTITKSKGDFCANTVKEAEDAGFRRAFRYRFKN